MSHFEVLHWQQWQPPTSAPELAFELESDLQDTVSWRREGFVSFKTGKTQLVSFDRSTLVLLM